VISQPIGKRRLLVSAVTVAGSIGIAIYGGDRGIDYRDVLVVGSGLIAALIVLGGHRGIQFGFVLWALSMAIGYRTFSVSKDLRIHPAEVLLWLLFAGILAHRQWIAENRVSLPLWVWLLLPFWMLGWWPLVGGDANWAAMFSEFRCFLILIPLLLVAQIVLKEQRHWRNLLLAFFAASTWIALMGALEYWVPSVTKLFPSFIANAKALPTADGFIRAQFSFWGNQNATFLCALTFPMCVVLWRWWRGRGMRLAIVIATILQLVAIYIGGYRSLWVIVVIQVTVACFFGLPKRGLAVAALFIVVAGVGYQFIPRTDERVISTIAALRMDPVDHSALVRKERALGALDDVLVNPFGGGWNSAGWVHSDFLQVAANLGIIAGLIFVGGYVWTFWKLAIGVKSAARIPPTDNGELGFSLLLAFIPVGGLLATQGVQVLPQLMLPVWLVWALVDVWLRQRSAAAEYSYAYAPTNFYPAPNFQ
jgi:hypothetical protein